MDNNFFMDNLDRQIQFDDKAPHVVFLGATNKIAFSMTADRYHHGLKVIQFFSNFYDAAAYVQVLGDRIPEKEYAWLVRHKSRVSFGGEMRFQTRESIFLPGELTTEQIKEAFTTVLDAKYGAGTYRLQYFLGYTDMP